METESISQGERKNKKIKKKMKPKQTRLVLNDPVLKKKLKGLYQNVFIAAIEIILNNFVFTCGK